MHLSNSTTFILNTTHVVLRENIFPSVLAFLEVLENYIVTLFKLQCRNVQRDHWCTYNCEDVEVDRLPFIVESSQSLKSLYLFFVPLKGANSIESRQFKYDERSFHSGKFFLSW